MMSKMTKNRGIDTNTFYGNQPIRRKPNHEFKDQNQSQGNRRLTDSRIDAQESDQLYVNYHNSNSEFPSNTLLSDRECHQLNKGLNQKSGHRMPLKSHSQKAMRGGNQSIHKRNGLKMFVNIENSFNSKYCDENDENAFKENKSESQTDIRDYMKCNSPISERSQTPKRSKQNDVVVTPLLSSNSTHRTSVDKRPKQPMSGYVNENRSPSHVRTNLFDNNDTEVAVNDELNGNLHDNENLVFINDLEMATIDPNNPIGLRNLGNTCYMNSIVQAIFALKFFIEDLKTKFDNLLTITEETNISMTSSLLLLYQQYNGLRNSDQNCTIDEVEKCLSNLKKCVGKKSSPFKTYTQQDAAEFFGHIIDTIMEEFDSFKPFSQIQNPIARNFEFETGGSLTCKKCNNKTKTENEKSHALYLSLPEDNQLQTAFDDFLKDETTPHQCVSANCGANENVLNKYFTKLPKVLFLQLGRYTEDGTKRTEEVTVPQNIKLRVKHNHSDNFINPIAPSPLATPYRTKLQDVFVSEKMSSVKRKMTFESDNYESFAKSIHKNGTNDMNCKSVNVDNVGLELDNNKSTENEETLVCREQLEVSCFDDSTPVTPIQYSNEGFYSQIKSKCNQSVVKKLFQENNVLNDKENTALVVNENNIQTEMYQLVAVICHHGNSLSGGHYSCYVYNIETAQWFQCDDNDISLTNFESVERFSRTSGYCYFYVHI